MVDEIERFATMRPTVAPPHPEVEQRAKERLMSLIERHEQEHENARENAHAPVPAPHGRPGRNERTEATVPGSGAAEVIDLGAVAALRRPERRRSRPVTALIAGAAAAIVAALMVSIVIMSDTSQPAAAEALRTFAAIQREQPAAPGDGPIRHVRFVDLTDEATPTYDLYLASDGSFVDVAGGEPVLEDAPSNLSTAELAGLPTDTDGARRWMHREASARGLGYPDERPERAVYRLSADVLTDPSVTPSQKAAVLEVLAGFDEDAISSRDVGATIDPQGRRGRLVEFRFDEGFVDQMIVDPATGALLATVTFDRNGDVFAGRVYLEQNMTDRVR